MHRTTLAAACALTALVAGCGSADTPEAASGPAADAARDRIAALGTSPTTQPSVVAGVLAQLPDSADARRRIGYVNVERLAELGGSASPAAVTRAVLGDGAEAATGSAGTVTQVGDATIVDGAVRRVIADEPADRARLEGTTPEKSAITDETPSAVQSCLGDGAAQTIVGPGVLGFRASIGVALDDTGDEPAGRKIVICAAPHYFRQLEQIGHELDRRYPGGHAEEVEIGERDIVRTAIPAGDLLAAETLALLRGGDALVRLTRAGGPGSGPT